MSSNFEKIYLAQVREIYDAEVRSIRALELMADATGSASLRKAFRFHLEETLGHVTFLRQMLDDLGQPARPVVCAAITRLVREAGHAAALESFEPAAEAARIEVAQRIEHFEIACYGSLRTYATVLGQDEAAASFQKILDEETDADLRLTGIAAEFSAFTQITESAAA